MKRMWVLTKEHEFSSSQKNMETALSETRNPGKRAGLETEMSKYGFVWKLARRSAWNVNGTMAGVWNITFDSHPRLCNSKATIECKECGWRSEIFEFLILVWTWLNARKEHNLWTMCAFQEGAWQMTIVSMENWHHSPYHFINAFQQQERQDTHHRASYVSCVYQRVASIKIWNGLNWSKQVADDDAHSERLRSLRSNDLMIKDSWVISTCEKGEHKQRQRPLLTFSRKVVIVSNESPKQGCLSNWYRPTDLYTKKLCMLVGRWRTESPSLENTKILCVIIIEYLKMHI